MRARTQLVQLLNRLQPPAEAVLLVLAIAVGLLTGTGVTLLRKLILLAQELYWHDLGARLNAWHPYALALVPVIGAGVVSLLVRQLAKPRSGQAQRIEAISKQLGQLPYYQVPLKTTAAALSLGAGASLGPEGPSVEFGCNVGSFFGQVLSFSSERTRLLVGAGGAAGLSAGFNAPIAGVFFALEVLLRDALGKSQLSLNADISVVVIASVVSALIAQLGLGAEPAFHLPVYDVRSPWELPLYMLLGVLASLVALAFSRSLKLTHNLAEALPLPQWLKLLGGGAVLGMTALVLPEAIGIGYETIDAILQDSPFSVSLLALILGAKLLLTPLSLASGFVGGIFAPALFLGGVLGSLYGKLLPQLIPIADAPAYALVGMAAVLAGTVRAPLTSVLLLFEMTRDYRIVLPLMASVGLCSWLIAQIQLPQGRVFNLGLQLNEIPENLEVLAQIRVADVMTLNPPTIQQSQSLLKAAQIMTSGYHHSIVVVDQQNCLAGILTNQDVKRILANPQWADRLDQIKVTEACTPEVLHTYADESVVDALKRMAVRDLRQLPVVERHLQKRVVALVDKLAIATAYESALTKAAIAEQIKISLEKNLSTGDNYHRVGNLHNETTVAINSLEP